MNDEAQESVIRLASAAGAAAVVYPAVGFNLIDWQVPIGGELVSVIHAEADVLTGGSGTRSGMPILFPFPNRIAGARFSWEGRVYELPVSGSDPPNAIHGFCAKTAWAQVRRHDDATVTGTFRLSRDAPGQVDAWPGDLELAVTYQLTDTALRVRSAVSNPGEGNVPFGLGFHPYFAPLGSASGDDLTVECPADNYWVLERAVPTGDIRPVSGANDLRQGPVIGDRSLDDVLTDLPLFAPGADGLMTRARLTGARATLAIRCDESFRDIVVFTPANRRSVAVEPYTCPTDAVHLDAAGRDVGWRSLGPGETWTGTVEYAAGPR